MSSSLNRELFIKRANNTNTDQLLNCRNLGFNHNFTETYIQKGGKGTVKATATLYKREGSPTLFLHWILGLGLDTQFATVLPQATKLTHTYTSNIQLQDRASFSLGLQPAIHTTGASQSYILKDTKTRNKLTHTEDQLKWRPASNTTNSKVFSTVF